MNIKIEIAPLLEFEPLWDTEYQEDASPPRSSASACCVGGFPFPDESAYRERVSRKVFKSVFTLEDCATHKDTDTGLVSLNGLPEHMYDIMSVPRFADFDEAADMVVRKLENLDGLVYVGCPMDSDGVVSGTYLAVFMDRAVPEKDLVVQNLRTGFCSPKEYKFRDGVFAAIDETRALAICRAALRFRKLARKHAEA